MINRRVNEELPFMATETILMEAVKEVEIDRNYMK